MTPALRAGFGQEDFQMSVRRMLVVGTMLLMTTGLWARRAPETQDKKMATKSGGGVEQALMDLENKWVEAGKKNDTALMESILADGFVSMDPDGTYTMKKDYVAGVGKAKWEISEVSNMKVHVQGNRAVVTGDWRGKGKDGNGKSVDTTEHWMDTFMKMPDGSWKAVSSGSTTAKK
jgi:ketosteroid isomerase-like protein